MKYHRLLDIKIISVLIFFISFYFGLTEMKAQNINQFTKDKKRTGVWKKYYSNNRIRYVGSFVNGKEVGVFKYYDISALQKFILGYITLDNSLLKGKQHLILFNYTAGQISNIIQLN